MLPKAGQRRQAPAGVDDGCRLAFLARPFDIVEGQAVSVLRPCNTIGGRSALSRPTVSVTKGHMVPSEKRLATSNARWSAMPVGGASDRRRRAPS